MDRLAEFGIINGQISKREFVDRLSAFPITSIKSLRVDLFLELSSLNVIPVDLAEIPLVTRRDSALRPLSQILSEDCWTLCDCILNKISLPRTLLKNGKKERSFVVSQHYPSVTASQLPVNTRSIRSTQADCKPPGRNGSTFEKPFVHHENILSNAPDSSFHHNTLEQPSHGHVPSQNEISNYFIARELASLREDLTDLKSDVFKLKNMHLASSTPTLMVIQT